MLQSKHEEDVRTTGSDSTLLQPFWAPHDITRALTKGLRQCWDWQRHYPHSWWLWRSHLCSSSALSNAFSLWENIGEIQLSASCPSSKMRKSFLVICQCIFLVKGLTSCVSMNVSWCRINKCRIFLKNYSKSVLVALRQTRWTDFLGALTLNQETMCKQFHAAWKDVHVVTVQTLYSWCNAGVTATTCHCKNHYSCFYIRTANILSMIII